MTTIVVSFASSKGGAGKTTSAFLLATILAKKGINVGVIDADPNHPFCLWEKQGGRIENLSIIKNDSEETILDDIEHAKKKHSFVIVDLEGTANLSVAYAVTSSDLVIIPAQRSQLDASEAAKVIGLIKRQSEVSKRTIPTALLFTRTSPAIRTKGMRRMQESLDTNQVDTFEVEINEREAFRAIWDYNSTLCQLSTSQVSGVDKARTNATAFAVEVLRRIQDIRNGKKEAVA